MKTIAQKSGVEPLTLQKKKVLFVGLTDYDLTTDDAVLREKMEGLSRDMHVHVLARGNGWHRQKYGVDFYLIPKVLGRFGIFLWVPLAFLWGFIIILEKKVEVIISQSPSLEGVVATLLAKITACKLVIEVHGDWVNGPFYYHAVPFESSIKKILHTLGKFSLRHADRVRVVSEFLRGMVLERAPRADIVKFIAFTPVDAFLNEEDITWNPTVVFVGSLYRVKGVDVLIRACITLKDEFLDMRLEILGEGPLRGELETLAEPLGERVHFHGHVPITPILKDAGVLVLPSRSEGLGRVLVEAAALGKPLVGSNTGGIPEIIREGQNGLLVAPDDVTGLTEALRSILRDKARAEAMGARGRELIRQEFSSERFFCGYHELINSL
jgi:glycosyltransferase involved in cell wall biosynthesis